MTREEFLRDTIQKHYTVRAYAARIGMPHSTLQSILKNVGGASIDNIIKICKGLGITTDDLEAAVASDVQTPLPCNSYRYARVGVSAGVLEGVEALTELSTIDVPDALLGRYAGNKNIMFLHVNGASMDRVIDDGALIAVKTDVVAQDLEQGAIVVACTDEGYTIKRFYNDEARARFLLKPDSTDETFLPIAVSYDEGLRLVGRVIMYNVIL